MAQGDGSHGSPTFFKRTSLFWVVSVSLAVSFYTWTVFWPDQVPYEWLGPLGNLSHYLVEHHYPKMYYGWWLMLMVHTGEAFYSLKVCSDKGVDNRRGQDGSRAHRQCCEYMGRSAACLTNHASDANWADWCPRLLSGMLSENSGHGASRTGGIIHASIP
ncbi:transmembrane protein 254 [Arapaima gigas]